MKKMFIILLAVMLTSACASTVDEANQASSNKGTLFAAKKGVFLSEELSDRLTKQAYSGVNSATQIVPLVSDLSAYQNAFNSTFLISNFPVSDSEKIQYRDALTSELGKAKRVAVADPEQSEVAVYSLCSYKLIDDKAVLEVLIGAADWNMAKSSGLKGADAFFRTTAWYAVSRKVVDKGEVMLSGEVASEKLMPLMISLASGPAKQLLAAY